MSLLLLSSLVRLSSILLEEVPKTGLLVFLKVFCCLFFKKIITFVNFRKKRKKPRIYVLENEIILVGVRKAVVEVLVKTKGEMWGIGDFREGNTIK